MDPRPEGLQHIQEINNGKRIIPTIVFPDGSILAEPSQAELLGQLGLQTKASSDSYELIIVGGGPAGLTAALYPAREGIDTLVIASRGLGGQAGTTEQLDNFPGFPEGVGDGEFADRLTEQALRLVVEILAATQVGGIEAAGRCRMVQTATGDSYCLRRHHASCYRLRLPAAQRPGRGELH